MEIKISFFGKLDSKIENIIKLKKNGRIGKLIFL